MPILTRRDLLAASAGSATALAGSVVPGVVMAQAGGRASVIDVALLGEAPSLDPSIFTNDVASVITQHFLETLYTFNRRWEARPLLAAALPETSADGRTVTIRLREGVQFHDGKPMQAEDVVASLERWTRLSPRGKLAGAVINSIAASGPNAVVISLKDRFAPLLSLLAMNNGAAIIIPRDLVAEAGEGPIKRYVGTGPYRFVEHRPDQYVRVARFDGYRSPAGAPDGYAGERRAILDEIRFLPVPNATTRLEGVLAGQFLFSENLPTEMYDRLTGRPAVRPLTIEPSWFTFFVMNNKAGPMANQQIRLAMRAALNMKDMLTAGFGEPKFFTATGSIYPEGTAFYDPNNTKGYNEANPRRAAELLKAAGYNGQPIRILTSQQFDYLYKMALVARENLQEAGFKIDIQVMDWASLTRKRENEAEWDAFTSLHAFVPEPSLLTFINPRYAGWSDSPEKRAALSAFNSEPDPAKRVQLWHRVQEIIYEQASTIIIGQYYSIAAASTRLKGFEPMPWAAFWNVSLEG